MSKRSDFPRRPMDSYQTPAKPVQPLLPFLRVDGIRTFSEPCRGEGRLVEHLEAAGLRCAHEAEIQDGMDALDMTQSMLHDVDALISNPPWTREILHPLIEHWLTLGRPAWLLFDADWMHTLQSVELLRKCSTIVSVGRVKWFEGSKDHGKDNCCWYRFDAGHLGPPRFYGRS